MCLNRFRVLILFMIIQPVFVFSQQVDNSKRVRVTVTDSWKSKSFLLVEDFWENKKEPIESQLGAGSMEIIKKYSYWKNIPAQMNIFNGSKKTGITELAERLDRLKVYKIATFRHIYQGIDWGELVILEVPYDENKDWDPAAKWDIVYFIVKAEAIKVIQ